MYAECQEMTQQASSLKAAARDMEAWERMGRGEVVIGGGEEEDGNGSSSGEEWGDDGDDEGAIRRRKAGVRGERSRIFFLLAHIYVYTRVPSVFFENRGVSLVVVTVCRSFARNSCILWTESGVFLCSSFLNGLLLLILSDSFTFGAWERERSFGYVFRGVWIWSVQERVLSLDSGSHVLGGSKRTLILRTSSRGPGHCWWHCSIVLY